MAGTPGRLGKALIRLLMKRATVTAVERLGGGFHLVTLGGEELRGVRWIPGQKVQVAMGSAFVARTYTPIEWDAGAGQTRLLGYAHGEGPGSDWLRNLAPGDECDLFGPRASLDPTSLAGPLALFGDETALGLACSLAGHATLGPPRFFLEADDAEAVRNVAARLRLEDATVLQRQADDAHLPQLERLLPPLVEAGASFALIGKARTIQTLRHKLKRLAVPSQRIATKAYWAPGKTGLD